MSELTAALATIEKCREITGCPAGVSLQDWVKMLASELSVVEEIHNRAVFITDELYDASPKEVQSIIRSLACMKMPAYACLVAGIKADGVEWIEGSEPREFGRYWVRYETDIGPQYCSAQWMEYNFCASSDTNIHKIWLADHSRSINSLKGVTHYTKLPASLEDRQLREGAK